MEVLGAAFFLVVIGGLITGIVLFTIDEQAEWNKRRANRKDDE